MNAAARVIHVNNFFSGAIWTVYIAKSWYFLCSLIMAVLVSALAVVYVTNEERVMFIELQHAKQIKHTLNVVYGELTLERASQATPARIESLAKSNWHMTWPVDKNTFMLIR